MKKVIFLIISMILFSNCAKQVYIGNTGIDHFTVTVTDLDTLEIHGIKYQRHSNGGGFVAEDANVSESVYVGPFSVVYSMAEVSGNVQIHRHSVIGSGVKINGNVVIDEGTQIYGDVEICGSVLIGSSVIHGQVTICGENITILWSILHPIANNLSMEITKKNTSLHYGRLIR